MQTSNAAGTSSAAITVRKGLVAHWTLDDVVNGLVLDRVGGYHGAVQGGLTSSGIRDGQIGRGIALDRTLFQYISTPLTTQLGDFTCTAWFYSDGTGFPTADYPRIVDKDYANGFALFHVGGQPANMWGCCVYDSSGGFGGTFMSTSFVLGKWNFITVLRTGGFEALFANGQFINAKATTATLTNTESVRIGNSPTSGGDFFPGMVDDVRIYNRQLSDFEILSIYEAGRCGRP